MSTKSLLLIRKDLTYSSYEDSSVLHWNQGIRLSVSRIKRQEKLTWRIKLHTLYFIAVSPAKFSPRGQSWDHVTTYLKIHTLSNFKQKTTFVIQLIEPRITGRLKKFVTVTLDRWLTMVLLLTILLIFFLILTFGIARSSYYALIMWVRIEIIGAIKSSCKRMVESNYPWTCCELLMSSANNG